MSDEETSESSVTHSHHHHTHDDSYHNEASPFTWLIIISVGLPLALILLGLVVGAIMFHLKRREQRGGDGSSELALTGTNKSTEHREYMKESDYENEYGKFYGNVPT